MIETGVRGPLPWRMSKRIWMIERGTGFLLRLPLMIIEPWRGRPASRCRVTLVSIQSWFFAEIRFLVLESFIHVTRVLASCSTYLVDECH